MEKYNQQGLLLQLVQGRGLVIVSALEKDKGISESMGLTTHVFPKGTER